MRGQTQNRRLSRRHDTAAALQAIITISALKSCIAQSQGCHIAPAPGHGSVAVGVPCAPSAPTILNSLMGNDCGPEHGGYSCPSAAAPHCDLVSGRCVAHTDVLDVEEQSQYDYCNQSLSENVALSKSVSVGGLLSSGHGEHVEWAAAVTDGNTSGVLTIDYCVSASHVECIEPGTRAHVTVDLGYPHLLSAVTVWHNYDFRNPLKYSGQKLALSINGDFDGEEIVVYEPLPSTAVPAVADEPTETFRRSALVQEMWVDIRSLESLREPQH